MKLMRCWFMIRNMEARILARDSAHILARVILHLDHHHHSPDSSKRTRLLFNPPQNSPVSV